MKKNRIIPFGYVMQKGEITPNPIESQAVKDIFYEYIKGNSMSAIASLMSIRGISYNGISEKWNKNMVKRILENKRYLGIGEYAALIEEDVFISANTKKKIKAATLNEIPKELQVIRSLTYCAECGHRISRLGGNTHSERWDCRNPECSRFEYRLTDNMIIGTILDVLNCVIANIEIINTDLEISSYVPSIEVKRQQNEINRLTDNSDVDFEKAKEEILKMAELKYNCCTYDEGPMKTKYLKELLSDKEQLNMLDIDLLKSCISRILIGHFYTIEIEFINGVVIKNITERTDKDDTDSSEC